MEEKADDLKIKKMGPVMNGLEYIQPGDIVDVGVIEDIRERKPMKLETRKENGYMIFYGRINGKKLISVQIHEENIVKGNDDELIFTNRMASHLKNYQINIWNENDQRNPEYQQILNSLEGVL